MERWRGRVAIVTGASAGIGAAIARRLAESGVTVVGVARRVHRVEDLSSSLRSSGCQGEVHAVQGDVTREEDVVRVVRWARDTLGGADVLVNNAGVFRYCPLPEASTENIRLTLDTNVLGLCLFTREVIKDMRDRGVDDGHIFHINSKTGHRLIDYTGVYIYSASKHAVTVMTEGLRRELRDLKTKIRVTSISPGTVRTEIMLTSGVPGYSADKMDDGYPILEPGDVADALMYALATPPHVQIHEIMMHPVGEAV